MSTSWRSLLFPRGRILDVLPAERIGLARSLVLNGRQVDTTSSAISLVFESVSVTGATASAPTLMIAYSLR